MTVASSNTTGNVDDSVVDSDLDITNEGDLKSNDELDVVFKVILSSPPSL